MKSRGVEANPVAFWGQRPRFESVWDYSFTLSDSLSSDRSVSVAAAEIS